MSGEERLPVNQDPPIIYQYYSTVTALLAQNGWYILVLVVCLYFLWRRVIEPMIINLRNSSQVVAHKKYDASEIERRQLAMDAHRTKLQDEHDRKAAEHAAKQAVLEEKKRQEKLEDWERHQSGQGYRSKVKKAVEENPVTFIKPKKKKLLRDDEYSPLMGNDRGESSSRRFERRGPAAGGG